MSLRKEKTQEIVKLFGISEGDTGSTQVQVALATRRIVELTEHMKIHHHDFSTQRGLLRLVSKRRKLLKYLSGKSYSQYRDLIGRLGLKK